MIVRKKVFDLESSGRHLTLNMKQAPISVCMDLEYGYVISQDNCIRKFDLSDGKTIGEWPVPMNQPFHHQMAVINGKIYYCNVNNNEIIILPTSEEYGHKESMVLGDVERPAYIADNMKHQKGTVIVSGASGVGKFPIMHGFSNPKWFTRVENARGVCVDDMGLIYVAKCSPSMICMLSQRTGRQVKYHHPRHQKKLSGCIKKRLSVTSIVFHQQVGPGSWAVKASLKVIPKVTRCRKPFSISISDRSLIIISAHQFVLIIISAQSVCTQNHFSTISLYSESFQHSVCTHNQL